MDTYSARGARYDAAHTALDAPDVLELLSHMSDKLDRLEAKVNQVELLADQAPGMLAMFTDTVDRIYSDCAGSGVNIEERVKMGLELLLAITEPHNMRAIASLTGQLEQVAAIAEQAPGLTAMAVDIADNFYAGTARSGVDLETAARNGLDAAGRLVNLLQSDQLKALMESGVLDPQTLVVVGSAANALVESRSVSRKAGPLALFGALFDPDVQRAAGFLLNFAQRFGKRMEQYTEEGNKQ